jgi:putative hydrolase of the HAD superfamily
MTAVDWIILDLGGIVVPKSAGRIMARVAHELGLPAARWAEAMGVYHDATTKGKLTLRQVYGAALHDLSLDASPEALLSLHLQLYRELFTQHDPDVVALINRLKATCQVACLTNTEPEIACICRETGLFTYFDRAYLSVDLGLKKPDREIYATVLADTECQPDRMVFVDDREENVEGARLAGMHALLFANVNQLERELSEFCPSALGPKTHCSNRTSGGDVQ